MSTDLNVESIVAQIRKRIAEESLNGQSSRHENGSSTSNSVQYGYRERMAEDSWRFADLDRQIESAALNIGAKPPVPPTWRGRVGSWIIDALRRLLWWYSAPLQETIQLLNKRNQEQAARHLQMQEQVVSLMDRLQEVLNRTEAGEDWRDESRASQQHLRRQVTSLTEQVAKLDVSRVVESLSRRFQEASQARLQAEGEFRAQMDQLEEKLQKVQGPNVVHAELEQRVAEISQAVNRRFMLLEGQLRSEAQKLLAGLGRVSEAVHDIEGRIRVFEQQLSAEVATREGFASQISGDVGQLQQKIRELRVTYAAADSSRAELAQQLSEAAHAVWGRLPVLETQLTVESEAREAFTKETRSQIERLEQSIAGQMNELKGHLQEFQAAECRARETSSEETKNHASHLGLALEKQRSELLVQQQRLSMFLREVRSRLPENLSEGQVRQMTEGVNDEIASLYAEFEDVFRGPREEIKERLKVYLPRLEKIKSPVLDLGCGRGEWLQLLSEHEIAGRGVDLNPSMISRCVALGLDVTRSDALAYLRTLPDKSLGAVTSFHMIEHLPFETVIAIVDEALRVLESGGLLILETPNPQNALVGSQTFWIDPTHIRPIPSQTLRFFVEARGFCAVEILNLQPYSETVRVPEGCGAVAQRFNEYFYGPQVYGVIGCRP